MTVWCHLPTIFNRRRALLIAGLITLCVALTTTLMLSVVSHAATGVNKTLSFQGRLLNSSGGVVADGHYNIQFKIYQDGTGTLANNSDGGGGTNKWTETYVNNGTNAGVEVINGYFSVNLGSKTAFGTSVDWNQDTLFLSMNVAGSSASCSTFGTSPCTADGEMLPMKRITSTPYALNSGQLGGKTADNFVQLAQGVQTDSSNNTSSIYVNKTGTGGNFLELQNAGADVFAVSNYGDITLGATTDPNIGVHYLAVAAAPAGTAGTTLAIAGGNGGSGTGSTGGTLALGGGNGGGTNGNGGDIDVDGGQATGTGTGGSVYIGAAYASNIQVGKVSGGNQAITIGNTTGTGTTTVAGGTLNLQSKNDTVVSTNGTQRARFSASGNTLYLGNADGSGQAATANGFTIQGTSSTVLNTQGGGCNAAMCKYTMYYYSSECRQFCGNCCFDSRSQLYC